MGTINPKINVKHILLIKWIISIDYHLPFKCMSHVINALQNQILFERVHIHSLNTHTNTEKQPTGKQAARHATNDDEEEEEV
jgi:hypothetical protein